MAQYFYLCCHIKTINRDKDTAFFAANRVKLSRFLSLFDRFCPDWKNFGKDLGSLRRKNIASAVGKISNNSTDRNFN